MIMTEHEKVAKMFPLHLSYLSFSQWQTKPI